MSIELGELVVNRVPLLLRQGKLVVADPIPERITRQVEGRGFTDQAQPGDWISIHYGWACEVLTDAQVVSLERFTRHNLAIANQTI